MTDNPYRGKKSSTPGWEGIWGTVNFLLTYYTANLMLVVLAIGALGLVFVLEEAFFTRKLYYYRQNLNDDPYATFPRQYTQHCVNSLEPQMKKAYPSRKPTIPFPTGIGIG